MPHLHRAILFPLAWPLGITAPPTRRPWATYFLLALNAALLGLLCFNPVLAERLALGAAAPPSWQYLTYAFTHGNLMAGFIDLLFLWTFGPALENRLGSLFLLGLYLLAEVAGASAHHFFPGTGMETFSGGAAVICALVGATMVLFPRDSVRLFLGIALLLKPIFARELRIPVFICALAYVGLELGLVHLSQTAPLPYVLERSGFSIAMHLGGLIAGAMLAGIFKGQSAISRPQRATTARQAAVLAAPAATPQSPPSPLAESFPAELASAGPQMPTNEASLAPEAGQPDELDPFSAAIDAANARPQPAADPSFAIFGNPGDSSFGALTPALTPPARKAPKKESYERKDPPPEDRPISFDLDSEDGSGDLKTVKNADPGTPEIEIPSLFAPPAAQPQPPTVPPKPQPDPAPMRVSPEHHPQDDEEIYRPDRLRIKVISNTPTPTWSNIPEPIPHREPPAETILSQEPVELQLEPSEETQVQAQALKDDTAWPDVHAGRFSVILPPGRPPKIASIVTLLADSLGLSLKGAYQMLQHRHGILADNVSQQEAEGIAERFAKAGHPVLLVALTNRIQFGGGLDLISIQEHQNHVLFTTVAQMIRGEWEKIVFLAAGQVAIAAGTPPRTVLDLFMVKPRHHLRLWDNSFSYSKEMPKFRAQALRITEMATKAIHTRSLDKWLRHASEPLHQFGSMIEYEHYVRWHLMAHLAPSKKIDTGKGS